MIFICSYSLTDSIFHPSIFFRASNFFKILLFCFMTLCSLSLFYHSASCRMFLNVGSLNLLFAVSALSICDIFSIVPWVFLLRFSSKTRNNFRFYQLMNCILSIRLLVAHCLFVRTLQVPGFSLFCLMLYL